jgi:hypothetical protein
MIKFFKFLLAVIILVPLYCGYKLRDLVSATPPVVTVANAGDDTQEIKKAYERGYNEGKEKNRAELVNRDNFIQTQTDEIRSLKNLLNKPAPQPVTCAPAPVQRYQVPQQVYREPYGARQRHQGRGEVERQVDTMAAIVRGLSRQFIIEEDY